AAEKKWATQILFHTDAVQAYGKTDQQVREGEVDAVSVSAHKIHGPKGMGALYVRKGLRLEPHIFGGGQEKGMRSGTENVPAVVGFGEAAEINQATMSQRQNQLRTVRQYLWDGIRREIPSVKINGIASCSILGETGFSSPAILNVSFMNVRGEVLLHTLEQNHIYVSTGSACASNKKGKSHVLTAMGLSEKEIEGAIRFSFSEWNTIEEMDLVLEALKTGVGKFRKLGSFR
ncbi:MAG: aminotransferase class V-fold PLP-dependent enzyme, partial [Anaerovorax sp.]